MAFGHNLSGFKAGAGGAGSGTGTGTGPGDTGSGDPALPWVAAVHRRYFCSTLDVLPPFVRVTGSDGDPDKGTFTNGSGGGDFEAEVGYFENDESTPYGCSNGTKTWSFIGRDSSGAVVKEYKAQFNFGDNAGAATPLADLGADPWSEIAAWLSVSGSGTAQESVVFLKLQWWAAVSSLDVVGLDVEFVVEIDGDCGPMATGPSNQDGVTFPCFSMSSWDDNTDPNLTWTAGSTVPTFLNGGLCEISGNDLTTYHGTTATFVGVPSRKLWNGFPLRVISFERLDGSVVPVTTAGTYTIGYNGGPAVAAMAIELRTIIGAHPSILGASNGHPVSAHFDALGGSTGRAVGYILYMFEGCDQAITKFEVDVDNGGETATVCTAVTYF